MNEPAQSSQPETFGRYLLYPAIARGGMATVHTARLVGAEGFTRLVAAKRLHPQFTDDPEFVTMFHDEACIASRIHHPNVVPVLDVVVSGNELILVQEYVHGVPLSQLMKVAQNGDSPIPIAIAIAVLSGVLAGLHGAHEVKDESGHPMEIVHRDVSPANVMISVDGVPRLLDFGIAKARTSTHHTREGVFKGKLAYMAPEQLRMEQIDRRADIYATGVLAWEMLVNRRVYDNRHELAFVTAVMNGEIPSILDALAESRASMEGGRWRDLVALEKVITRAMSPNSEDRFDTAADMARALLDVRPASPPLAVAEWVGAAGAEFLEKRQKSLAANEESWRRTTLFTPSSGTQRVTPGAIEVSAPPPSITGFTAAQESGAFRVSSAAPVTSLGTRVRASRYLPWFGALALLSAVALGGFLRGTDPDPTADPPAAAAATLPPATTLSPVPVPVPVPGSPAAAAAAGSAVAAASPTATPSPSTSGSASSPSLSSSPPTTVVQAPVWRPIHTPPPPPPPRFVAPPPRPAPAASPNAATPGAKSDCNPPFFFEGSKKIFKQSCL